MDLPSYHPDQLATKASAEKNLFRKLLISILVLGCVAAFIVYVRRVHRNAAKASPSPAPTQAQGATPVPPKGYGAAPWSPPPGQSIVSISGYFHGWAGGGSGSTDLDGSFVVTQDIGGPISQPTVYHTYQVLDDGTATPLGTFLQYKKP